MDTRDGIIRSFIDEGIDPAEHLETFEASEWLTATDAPKDAAVNMLLDGMSEAKPAEVARLNRLIVSLLVDVSADKLIEFRDTVRSLVIDQCKAEIAREFQQYDVDAIRATPPAAKLPRVEDCMFHRLQAG